MGDDVLRRKMAVNAVKSVQRFSIERIAESWKELFESVTK